jgi:hypothetical protein
MSSSSVTNDFYSGVGSFPSASVTAFRFVPISHPFRADFGCDRFCIVCFGIPRPTCLGEPRRLTSDGGGQNIRLLEQAFAPAGEFGNTAYLVERTIDEARSQQFS